MGGQEISGSEYEDKGRNLCCGGNVLYLDYQCHCLGCTINFKVLETGLEVQMISPLLRKAVKSTMTSEYKA